MNGNGKSVAMMSLFRRGFMLVALLAVGISVFGQTLTQQGVTCRYNGAKPHTPLGNVYIKVGSAGNAVKSDSLTGKFALTLSGLRMGMRIGRPVVVKKGMMVFNQQAVDEWSVRMEPLCVVLCDADFFQRQKNTLIEHGKRIARQKCDRRINWLEQQLKDNRLREEEYIVKLDSVQRELEMAQQQMDGCADVLARIDLSEVDTLSQRAIDLFYKGDFDAALRLFESGDYRRKLSDAIRLERDAEALRQKADTVVQLARGDQKRYAESLRAQLASYKMNNEWDKALELQKYLADTLCTLREIGDCAQFCMKQNIYDEAETYFKKFIAKAEQLMRGDSVSYAHWYAAGLTDMASLYYNLNRYGECEKTYRKVISLWEGLAASAPEKYDAMLATAQMNFALVCSNIGKWEESERLFLSSLALFERLNMGNSGKFDYELALVKHNLSLLYLDEKKYAESERYCKEANSAFGHLAGNATAEYEHALALSKQALGDCYFRTKRLSESEAEYKASLSLLERLAQENPQAFTTDLNNARTALGSVLLMTDRYAECERMYDAALSAIDSLSAYFPSVYEPYKASILYKKAILYKYMRKYQQCEQMCKEALTIYVRFAEAYPQVYGNKVVKCQNFLAERYEEMKREDDAERMYRSSVATLKRLSATFSLAFDASLASAEKELARFLYVHSRSAESEGLFAESLSIYERLAKHSDAYSENVLEVKEHLVNVYIALRKYEMAYRVNNDILPTLKKRADGGAKSLKFYVEQLSIQAVTANMLGRFSEAETIAKEMLQLNKDSKSAYRHLGIALLMKGKYNDAEQILMKWCVDFPQIAISYLDRLARQGVIPAKRRDDVEMLKKKLEERKW